MEVNGHNHTSGTLCPGKSPHYSLKRELGGPQRQFWCFE